MLDKSRQFDNPPPPAARAKPLAPSHSAARRFDMRPHARFQDSRPPSRRSWIRRIWAVLGLGLCLAAGCSAPGRNLRIWRMTADLEHVARFDEDSSESQWFARVMEPHLLPARCVHPLSDRFAFLLITDDRQWTEVLKATNLERAARRPRFSQGLVVGLLARVGEPARVRWPVFIEAVRQRGPVVFIIAEFAQGFYRPLDMPAYLHLVFVPGATDVLGVKLNHMLYGFNVDIADLHDAGIR